MANILDRKDVVWQREDTVASYQLSRQGLPFVDAQFELVERVLRAHGSAPSTVLDIGCGDGIAAQAMIERFPIERVVLVDFSEPMLNQARERFASTHPIVTTVLGDLLGSEWLPEVFSKGPFDLVISRYAIHHLPDERKRSLYEEIFTLLNSSGWFVNLEHVQSVNAQYQNAFEGLLIDGIHGVAMDDFSREDVERSFHQRQDADTNLLTPVELQCEWLRDIGFVDVDCVFKALELAVFASRHP